MTTARNPDEAPTAGSNQGEAHFALVIDVEHALARADLALEALIASAKLTPFAPLTTIGKIITGQRSLDHASGDAGLLDAAHLPIDERVIGRARAAAEAGREVYLCSASGERLAEDLRQRFDFVTGAIAGTIAKPLDGAERARFLTARFPLGFDYIGGTSADLPVWQSSRKAIAVGLPERSKQGLFADVSGIEVLPPLGWLGPLVRSLRLQQWLKNVLVLAPLVLGGKIGNLTALLATLAAFVAMGLVASATYIINDALDLKDDRKHWSKRHRPLASGALPLSKGLLAAAILLMSGLGLAAMIGSGVLVTVCGYSVLTFAYSLWIKRLAIVDGLTLAVLYTLRLVVGIAAAGVPPSPWLLGFSMLLFMSLSLAKRYGELQSAVTKGLDRLHGRAYQREDIPFLLALGVSAGVSAVVVVVLYILDDAFKQSFYGWTIWLWGFPPLMFLLVARIWLIAVRGEMGDDPIDSALRDRTSQIALMLLLLCFSFAWLG